MLVDKKQESAVIGADWGFHPTVSKGGVRGVALPKEEQNNQLPNLVPTVNQIRE